MAQSHYEWVFGEIGDRLDTVSFVNRVRDETSRPRVSVKDWQILKKSQRRIPSIAADVLDVTMAIQFADWLSYPNPKGEQRVIEIAIPVRHPEKFDDPIIRAQLQTVLYWETGDHWLFRFKKRKSIGRFTELQNTMWPTSGNADELEVALFSGGLDSMAGLCQRLTRYPQKQFVLFSLGSNNNRLRAKQEYLARRISERSGRVRLVSVDFQRRKDSRGTNSLFRARGFAFLMAGAANALIEQQNVLYIYENGIGAFNLPFRLSEVGVDHSRAVHPLSLLYAGQLISSLFETKFSFVNPFLYSTKAEMCTALVNASWLDLILETVTCDRLWPQSVQCGYCSSCLLRRQALAYLGIEDKTPYRTTLAQSAEDLSRMWEKSHFYHMRHQAETLGVDLDSPDPWQKLSRRFPSLLSDTVHRICRATGESPELMIAEILDLYGRYVHEWDTARDLIAPELQFDDMDLRRAG